MDQITENIFVETQWRGANVGFIVTSEGIVTIDVPPDIENAKKWAGTISKKGRINYVINTEFHHDHWITNSLFGGIAITHDLTRKTMLFMDHKFIKGRTDFLYYEPLHFPDEFQIKLPSVTFSGNMTLRLGKHTFQLIHVPGHTEGQIAVYIPEEKVIFASDSVSAGIRTPFHDAITDDIWLDSLKTLADLDAEFTVPGHGPILSGGEGRAAIEKTDAVVRGFLEAVRAGRTDGGKMSEELYRSIDPFYENKPMGIRLETTLGSSAQGKKTGTHGSVRQKDKKDT